MSRLAPHGLGMVAALAMILTAVASGQPRAPEDTPGTWRGIEATFTNYPRLTPQERRHLGEQFTAVVDVFKSAVALDPPIGLDITPEISNIDLYSRFTVPAGRPLPAMMWMRMNRYVVRCPTCAPEPDHLWGGAFMIIANAVDALYPNWRNPTMRLEDQWYYVEPRIQGRVGGFPEYEGGAVAVTTRSGPLFLPVTRERFVQARIQEIRREVTRAEELRSRGTPYDRHARGREQRARDRQTTLEAVRRFQPAEKVAEMEAQMEKHERDLEERLRKNASADAARLDQAVAAVRGRLQRVEDELAALSDEQRRAPAMECPRRTASGLCATPDSPDARRLVVANPGVFDPALPRTKFQLLVIIRRSPGAREVAPRRALDGGWRTLDWQRLAMLTR